MEPNSAEITSTSSTTASEDDLDNAGPVSSQDSVDEQETETPPSRPLKIYSRQQILALNKSPLVCLPDGMPELKDWFGTENEQNLNRKDSEPLTTNGGRDRRFRRDAEDGDLPARPSFRSAASQPSQMGNFRHHSLRSSDREMDRDREGERLRNLSDKFDRDRLSISLRKDRDLAPHFCCWSEQNLNTNVNDSDTRAEAREGNKKKVGESSEDWRRGTDSRRSERDDRDSRARDSSTSRQDRGKERDRDRDDYRRERDREDPDDLKRWRDDGKKDERLSTRRERGRDKPSHENSWENGDRRWALSSDDKDRTKKAVGRDKKTVDDNKERDDRRIEREKEKEPAWMDEYIPASPGGGILGGKGNDGELDGIQAWKKNMKEKEQKSQKPSKPSPTTQESTRGLDHTEPPEQSMDEIQQFKKMMELAQKQKTPPSESGVAASSVDSTIGRNPKDNISAQKAEPLRPIDPTQSLLSLLTSQAPSAASSNASSNIKLHSATEISPMTSERSIDNTESNTLPIKAPQGSRLLALGSRAPAKPQTSQPIPNGSPLSSHSQKPNLVVSQTEGQGGSQASPRSSNGFSPFEEQRDQSEALRRVPEERASLSGDSGPWDVSGGDLPGLGNTGGRGSRFAKFFDAKGKEAPAPHSQVAHKAQGPIGYVSSSPIPGQRSDFNNAPLPSNADHRTVEELFAKLNTQVQPPRNNATLANPSSGMSFSNLQQQHLHHQLQPHHPQPQQSLPSQHLHHPGNSRVEPFIETRNFTPDGLVPGLRSVPPPRGREHGPMFQDHEELLNAQRLNLQQRALEQLYPGSLPAGFAQQGNRNVGLTLQQQQFRGGPSPTLQVQHTQVQQRLPPGLANLGGRPPHDPQMLGLQGNIGSQLHHISTPQQHNFNNFHPHNSNVGYGGPQHQLRAPPPSNTHGLSGHQLGGLGGPGGLDLRNSTQQQQAQLLAMSGLGGNPLRGVSNNAYNQITPAQMQNPLLAQMRQQQQQQQPPQLPPHMVPHMIPPHLQQQQQVPMSSNQSAQDLMALLMGGAHRE